MQRLYKLIAVTKRAFVLSDKKLLVLSSCGILISTIGGDFRPDGEGGDKRLLVIASCVVPFNSVGGDFRPGGEGGEVLVFFAH